MSLSRIKRYRPPKVDEHPADDKLVGLFEEWLAAFEAMNAEALADRDVLAGLESRIAATPAEGLRGLTVKLGLHRGLAVKLGLHHFLNDEADSSVQFTSAYRDLVRLTGRDPASDISTRFEANKQHLDQTSPNHEVPPPRW